jgi:hypothetical protein
MLLLTGVQILHLPGRSSRLLIDISDMSADYSAGRFFKGCLYFDHVGLSLEEARVIRDDRLYRSEQATPAEDDRAQGRPVRIDVLDLSIRRITYTDYSLLGPPLIMSYDIHHERQYRDVANPYTLIQRVIMEEFDKKTTADVVPSDR